MTGRERREREIEGEGEKEREREREDRERHNERERGGTVKHYVLHITTDNLLTHPSLVRVQKLCV